jgi:hypothetical protein
MRLIQSEADSSIRRIKNLTGVKFLTILDDKGEIKANSLLDTKDDDNQGKDKGDKKITISESEQLSKIIRDISIKARSTVRDLDPTVHAYTG